MSTSYLQGVRCFFSVDLVGSTGLKSDPNMLPTKKSIQNKTIIDWIEVHLKFYDQCIGHVLDDVSSSINQGSVGLNNVHFWRTRGDEVLFYSNRIRTTDQIFSAAYTFCEAVKKVDEFLQTTYSELRLGARGTMWAAGFPIRNREMLISNHAPHVRPLNPKDGEEMPSNLLKTSPHLNVSSNIYLEFLGPEIDLGFMLSPHVNAGRVVISADIANMLASVGKDLNRPLVVHHVGWKPLKTLYQGTPYPIFWIDSRKRKGAPKLRRSYEQALSTLSEKFFDHSSILDDEEILELCDLYLRETQKFGRIKMYLVDGDAPEKDLVIHNIGKL